MLTFDRQPPNKWRTSHQGKARVVDTVDSGVIELRNIEHASSPGNLSWSHRINYL